MVRFPQMVKDEDGYVPRLYGRRQGKPLKKRQAQLLETLLPEVAVPDPELGRVDPRALFPQAEEIWLEIGFGGGEHLVWQARHHPNVGMIGAESYVNGVGKLLSQIEDEDVPNIRIHFGDGRPLVEALPDRSLSRMFVLFPDPWPKKRHAKRRIVSPWFFREAARVLKSAGELRIASDIPDYVRWTLMLAQRAPGFEWAAKAKRDWSERPDDWPRTRYEAKAVREGRSPAYLVFRRKKEA
jgi:tRNA (guanine-N7-)-methyltransferase